MLEKFVRRTIREMKPYKPILPFEILSQQLGKSPDTIIKLDANENPYGPSPKTLAALRGIPDILHIYPDPESRFLRNILATWLQIDSSNILIGAGADELIDLIMRMFLDPGDMIIDCPPTFSMYAFDAQIAEAKVIQVPRNSDFTLNLDLIEKKVEEKMPKLLFLCSPNNPDGGVLKPDELEHLLQLPLIVIVDEAYIEFSDSPSAVSLVSEHTNLIVLRTFSKWAGLAGLRVGYGVFPAAVMEHLWKMKQPYNLNVAADIAARASLQDIDYLENNVRLIISERNRLSHELADIDYLIPYPSQSNFVLCKVIGKNAAEIQRRLAKDYGILIRYFNKPGIDDHIRITAGKPEHTDRLLMALKEIA